MGGRIYPFKEKSNFYSEEEMSFMPGQQALSSSYVVLIE